MVYAKSVVVSILIVIFIGIALFFMFTPDKSPGAINNPLNSPSLENNSQPGTAIINGNLVTLSPAIPSSSGAGGGGGGGGSGSEFVQDNKIVRYENTLCGVVRPGGLPGIQCSVSDMTRNSIVISIYNYMNSSFDANVSLEGCNPFVYHSIKVNEFANFAFSCANEDSVGRKISASYLFDNATIVSGEGIVIGTAVYS